MFLLWACWLMICLSNLYSRHLDQSPIGRSQAQDCICSVFRDARASGPLNASAQSTLPSTQYITPQHVPVLSVICARYGLCTNISPDSHRLGTIFSHSCSSNITQITFMFCCLSALLLFVLVRYCFKLYCFVLCFPCFRFRASHGYLIVVACQVSKTPIDVLQLSNEIFSPSFLGNDVASHLHVFKQL